MAATSMPSCCTPVRYTTPGVSSIECDPLPEAKTTGARHNHSPSLTRINISLSRCVPSICQPPIPSQPMSVHCRCLHADSSATASNADPCGVLVVQPSVEGGWWIETAFPAVPRNARNTRGRTSHRCQKQAGRGSACGDNSARRALSRAFSNQSTNASLCARHERTPASLVVIAASFCRTDAFRICGLPRQTSANFPRSREHPERTAPISAMPPERLRQLPEPALRKHATVRRLFATPRILVGSFRRSPGASRRFSCPPRLPRAEVLPPRETPQRSPSRDAVVQDQPRQSHAPALHFRVCVPRRG